jgi:hypothetical protein
MARPSKVYWQNHTLVGETGGRRAQSRRMCHSLFDLSLWLARCIFLPPSVSISPDSTDLAALCRVVCAKIYPINFVEVEYTLGGSNSVVFLLVLTCSGVFSEDHLSIVTNTLPLFGLPKPPHTLSTPSHTLSTPLTHSLPPHQHTRSLS